MRSGRLTPPVGDDDHVAGPPNAPVTLVEYGDFECPYCGQAYPIVKDIERRLGPQLRFVYRHFPLKESHPHAQHAAAAAEAAGAEGKFWAMHNMLFEHQRRLADRDLVRYAGAIGLDAEQVARDLELDTYAGRVREQFRSGVRSGVNGTPTFFINGERFDGNWADEEEFVRALLEAAELAGTDARG
jgi:protein-disulfide isomerase